MTQIVFCDRIKEYEAGQGWKKEFKTKKEATNWILFCMAGCDPSSSECSRYTQAFMDLLNGKKIIPLY
jgi:hypothetical protein